MKSERGVTLTSIMIYVIALTVAVLIIGRITNYFYKNINYVANDTAANAEYTKFNSYFTDEINIEGNEVELWEENYILFGKSQNQYTFQSEGIYRGKTKISKNVESCKFSYNEETREITVNLTIYGKDFTTTYTVAKEIKKNTNITIEPAESENLYSVLYTDGTLVFTTDEDTVSADMVSKNYGDIVDQTYTSDSEVQWYEDRESITTVNFLDEIIPTDTSYWFYGCTQLTTFENMQNLNTELVESMNSMFGKCSSLTTLNVTNFKTENVTDMSNMFYYCTSLTSLNLNNFDTSSVTSMFKMFRKCSALTSLYVSNFNTEKVTDMNNMFSECSSLTELDLEKFNTTNVNNMQGMFAYCSNIITLDLSMFETANVTNMESMFGKCSALTSLDISNFNTEKVTSMHHMFLSCTNLQTINMSRFDNSNVTDMEGMFASCTSLTSLDLSNFGTSNVITMTNMFNNCSALASLIVSNFNTEKVTSMYNMFLDCSQLTTLDLTSFNTSSVTDMDGMFAYTTNLTTIKVSSSLWTTQNATTENMFLECGTTSVTEQ